MSEDQKKYYNAMKKLGSKQPQKPIPKPKVCSEELRDEQSSRTAVDFLNRPSHQTLFQFKN